MNDVNALIATCRAYADKPTENPYDNARQKLIYALGMARPHLRYATRCNIVSELIARNEVKNESLKEAMQKALDKAETRKELEARAK